VVKERSAVAVVTGKGYKNASSPVNRVCGRIPRIPPESATGHDDVKHTLIILNLERFCANVDYTMRCYAECGYATVSRLSVRPSVTLKYVFHTVWNTSKIISRPNSLRLLLGLTQTWAIWCNGINTPKIRVECGWGHSGAQKNLQYLQNGAS